MNINKYLLVSLSLISILVSACNTKSNYLPKPRGYFRIDFPEKKYQHYQSDCPYSFDFPNYSKISDYNPDSCWINIDFPKYKGTIHISYKVVENNIQQYIEDSRTLVYKHTIKADAIKETLYKNDEKKVYGILYDIKGNTASSLQFFLTDSINHFYRGALYFNTRPNKDSLNPVINFIKEDITYLIESFEWK